MKRYARSRSTSQALLRKHQKVALAHRGTAIRSACFHISAARRWNGMLVARHLIHRSMTGLPMLIIAITKYNAKRRLRTRYDEFWAVIGCEVEKQRGKQIKGLEQRPADAEDYVTADVLMGLSLAEIDRVVKELRAV